jgi:hypothetical protein
MGNGLEEHRMACIQAGSALSSRLFLLQWVMYNKTIRNLRILLEKLIVSQLVKKFPALYGT